MNVQLIQNKRSELFPVQNIIDLENWVPTTPEERSVFNNIRDAVEEGTNEYSEPGYRTHNVITENDLNIEPPCQIDEIVYVSCI
jgi:hypothetical protein